MRDSIGAISAAIIILSIAGCTAANLISVADSRARQVEACVSSGMEWVLELGGHSCRRPSTKGD